MFNQSPAIGSYLFHNSMQDKTQMEHPQCWIHNPKCMTMGHENIDHGQFLNLTKYTLWGMILFLYYQQYVTENSIFFFEYFEIKLSEYMHMWLKITALTSLLTSDIVSVVALIWAMGLISGFKSTWS